MEKVKAKIKSKIMIASNKEDLIEWRDISKITDAE